MTNVLFTMTRVSHIEILACVGLTIIDFIFTHQLVWPLPSSQLRCATLMETIKAYGVLNKTAAV